MQKKSSKRTTAVRNTSKEEGVDPSSNATSSSWEGVSDWYDSIVGKEGHYYHQAIVLPGVLRLLELQPKSSLLDIACGQGVLARAIPKGVTYTGLDISKTLIRQAQTHSKNKDHIFKTADVTQPLPLETQFSHAACVLAIQNIQYPDKMFTELSKWMQPGGRAVFVINHPCFRIPRNSQWQFEESTKSLLRAERLYMSELAVPIASHQKNEASTISYHYPLSAYIKMLSRSGFVLSWMEEWCTDKKSEGGAQRWENRAKREFPLFLALVLERR
jgi:ubiquinone/menaquinone biosynthesis C-methylase UbiE